MEHINALPKFTEFNELCSKSAGGKVLFATDDYFAAAENMISDCEPVFIADKYTEFGKWMDGWETRRKRKPGHDWCILKLGSESSIHGIEVDTAFFTGNFAPKYSVQAARLTQEEENAIPKRANKAGIACTAKDLQQVNALRSDAWQQIVPKTSLRPGYESTRRNYQKVITDETYSHIRLNVYPDGGIARFRVFGVTRPGVKRTTLVEGKRMVDLVAVGNGGACQGYSNAHYGHPRNLIKAEKALNMGDGWETARRLDRPDVIHLNEDGTLKVPGNEWAVFKLGINGTVCKICVDTNHFKGNFPDNVKIEGALLHNDEWSQYDDDACKWSTILPTSKLSAHSEHWYGCDVRETVSHVRITMAPDGGISRIRLFSYEELC